MNEYAVETERVGPLRWVWAISLPDPRGPSLLSVGYEGSFHPYQGEAIEIDGYWYKRVRYGWAFSEKGAKRRARKAILKAQGKTMRDVRRNLSRRVEL